MNSSRSEEKFSFFKIPRLLFRPFALLSHTPTETQPPMPHPDLESSGTMAAAAKVDSGGATASIDPGDADSTNNNNSRSSWRNLTELLSPATFCTGIFYSIPSQVQDHQHYHDFLLYEPLLALVLLGISSSVVAIFYALRRSQPAAIEVEKTELDKEKFQRTELVKEKLLEVGLLYSLFALLLRVMLQLSLASLGRLAAMFFVGGMAGAIHFYIASRSP